MGEPEKKTLDAVSAYAEATFETLKRTLLDDPGAGEQHVRASGLTLAKILLQGVVDGLAVGQERKPLRCGCGRLYNQVMQREKVVQTIVGEIRFRRYYYYRRECGCSEIPLDRQWHMEETGFSAELQRFMGEIAAWYPFVPGAEVLSSLTGVHVSGKDIERIAKRIGAELERTPRMVVSGVNTATVYISMDGTGVPVVKRELQGRRGKGNNGEAKSREARLGCMFTQTAHTEQGEPIRDEQSTTYVGAIETAEEFAQRIEQEAQRRNVDGARQVVVLGDAASWIDTIVQDNFPRAQFIIDLYHAREHYWTVARSLWPHDPQRQRVWALKREKELDAGQVQKVIMAIKRLHPRLPQAREICHKEIAFFAAHGKHMRYDKFRAHGLFVGSGVVEAGCKSIIGQRLKQAGMHWSVSGANHIIALRTAIASHEWQNFWETRWAA
jgi:hypothetical protein